MLKTSLAAGMVMLVMSAGPVLAASAGPIHCSTASQIAGTCPPKATNTGDAVDVGLSESYGGANDSGGTSAAPGPGARSPAVPDAT